MKLFVQIKKLSKRIILRLSSLRFYFEKNIPLSSIRILHIVFGMACNQRCTMCFQRDFHSRIDAAIYKEKLLPIYPHLKEVILQGGEVTIYPEVKEYIEFLITKYPQIRFSILTNGLKFDEYWADKFINYGSSVNFSLNAITQKTYDSITRHGDWGKVTANLKRLILLKKSAHSKLKVWASFVVLNENLHELGDFIIFANNLGLNGVRYFYDPSLLPEDKQLVAQQIAKARSLEKEFKNIEVGALDSFEAWALNKAYIMPGACPAPVNQIFVTARGDVSFCCHIAPFGNLHFCSVGEIWNSLKAKMYRKLISRKNYSLCGNYCRPHRISTPKPF